MSMEQVRNDWQLTVFLVGLPAAPCHILSVVISLDRKPNAVDKLLFFPFTHSTETKGAD